ncbi:MAG: uracil-DNA glycosylase family protein [Candidatus Saccharibacteria bacterium]
MFTTQIDVGGRMVKTLEDIVPDSAPLNMMIIGKSPGINSINSGHYFQSKQGRLVWSMMKKYGLLKVPYGKHEDEVLIEHGYGIAYVVRRPHPFAVEATDDEFMEGIQRIEDHINRLQPSVVMFAYKSTLDRMLRLKFERYSRSYFGFNPELDDILGYKVFVMPLPGSPVKRERVHQMMSELRREVNPWVPHNRSIL